MTSCRDCDQPALEQCPSCGVSFCEFHFRIVRGADLFCGAGGSSKGAMQAIAETGGHLELVAINHWQKAIDTHRLNLPAARAYVEDVSLAVPSQLVPEGYLDFLWVSPECTFFSTARGGKPVHDQGRMHAWAIQRWLTELDVRCLLVENVPEFVKWGPVMENGKPDPARRGDYFQAWRKAIVELGYEVDFRVLNAANYGDATTRRRFFLQARKDSKPIVWPEPSHGKQGEASMFPQLPRWRSARQIIDWTLRGRSVLDHPKYKRTPLSLKTRMRMARGLERFGGPLAPLFVCLLDLEPSLDAVSSVSAETFVMGKQSNPTYRGLEQPLPTVTTESASVLVEPSVELVGANRNNNVPRSVEEPIPPATTAPGGGLYMVEVVAEPFVLGQQSGGAPRDVEEPTPTVAGAGAIALIEPIIIPYYRTGVAKATDDPLETISTRARFGLSQAMVVPYGPRAEAREDSEPLPTILTKPLPTILTKDRLAIASFIVPQFSEREGQAPRVHSVEEPLPAATSHGAGRLVEPVLCDPLLFQVNHGEVLIQTNDSKGDQGRIRSVDEPLWTATTHRTMALAEPVLERIRNGDIDPRRLVIIDDQLYQLDIHFRMLTNRELARAMSFDDDEAEYEFVGTSSEVTKQIGNAVPVRTAAALVKAVLS